MMRGAPVPLRSLSSTDKRMASLRQSARTVTATLLRDEQQVPDPWDLLQSSYSRDFLPSGAAAESQLSLRQVHVIPDILLAQFEGRECKCFMGLLPVIGRAWMSVDNRLFLWDFATGRDFACFDELDQTIIDVALVRPREGVFIPIVKHLLLVVTAAQIILLGISFSGTDEIDGDLTIHRTGLVFPSDEVNMLAVVGTRTGRIFAGGQDGNLHEFLYQSEEGWFTRKCRKQNKTSSPLAQLTPTFLKLTYAASPIIALAYDQHRDLLYALGDDSSIQLFFLSSDDSGFAKIAHSSDLLEQASRLCPAGLLNRKSFKVISINVVEKHESAFIHLIAISSCGVKLYFTTLGREERACSRTQLLSTKCTPSLLEMVHVRLPPEGGRHKDARRMIHAWNPNIHTALYARGVSISASAISKQEDILIATMFNQSATFHSTSATRNAMALESVTDIAVDGKVWDIREAPSLQPAGETKPGPFSSIFAESTSPIRGIPQSFLVLSNAGVHVLQKTGPVEDLQRILIETGGNCDSDTLCRFVEEYSAEQTCFFCIVLACSMNTSWRSAGHGFRLDNKVSTDLTLWTVNTMLKIGGEPKLVENPSMPTDYLGLVNPTNVLSANHRLDHEFSPLHRALYMYFARLMAKIWGQPFLKISDPGKETLLALHTFKEFLDRNAVLTRRTSSTKIQANSIAGGHDVMALENESIEALKVLITSSLELVAFWSICRDYNVLEGAFKDIGAETLLADWARADVEELLSSKRGREIIANLGSLLVEKQIKMKASVDSLCQILLQRCPTFFGNSEIIVFHGTECLERAKQTREPSERHSNLELSLANFLKGCVAMTPPMISAICQQYQKLGYFPGIVELCLAASSHHDPQNVSLMLIRNPGLQLSTEQQESLNTRESFYSLVFATLEAAHGLGITALSLDVDLIDMEKLQAETLACAVKSKDEAFHLRLYEWFIDNGMSHLLLGINSPFILTFLQARFAKRVDAAKDLLWKYLAKQAQYLQAAKVLDEMATSPEFNLVLEERIERLSLALGNAKSETNWNSMETLEYVQDLEERLEVAKLQHQLLEAILAQFGEVSEVTDLNGTLYDVTRLFNQFARPLKLWECALLILHCASYQDPLLIHQFWTNIIEKALDGNNLRFDLLSQKVIDLAKRLYPSPFAFPLNFVLDSLLVISIKHKQPVDWIASIWTHSIVPTKAVLEQCAEFLKSQAVFWLKVENREYLVEAMITMAEKGTCSRAELRRIFDGVQASLTSPSAKAWLEQTFKD